MRPLELALKNMATLGAKRFPSITSLAMALFLAACANPFGLDVPLILRTEPSPEAEGVSTNSPVRLAFSAPMDVLTTEGAFSVSGNGEKIEGRFVWESPSNLLWRPMKPFWGGAPYEVTLATRAEDETGNNLTSAYTLRFSTAGNSTLPQLVSMAPADRSAVPAPTNLLELVFNTPMDVEAVKGALSFSPSPGQVITADASGKCFTVVFREKIQFGVKTTVSLSAGTKAKNGKGLPLAYSAYFWIGDDFTPPTLLSLASVSGLTLTDGQTTGGFEKDDRFIFEFSKEVDGPSVQGSFSVSPYMNLVWQWPSSSRAILRPDPSFTAGGVYRFALGEGWKDTHGNRAAKPFSAYATFDGPGSAPLSVTNLSDESGSTLVQNCTAPVPAWDGPVLRFSAAVKTATVVSAFSIARVSGSGSGGALIQRFDFQDGDHTVRLRIAGLTPGNVYKITLQSGASGARDLRDNVLGEDWIFFFQS
jgi:hypothetical protein